MNIPNLSLVSSERSYETVFEKKRGVSSIEIRTGYAQVHIDSSSRPITKEHVEILQCITDAEISIYFLKLTLMGLAFVVPEEVVPRLQQVLQNIVSEWEIQPNRNVVLVYAVNMRDEEGLIAQIVSLAIAKGISIDHVGDMHDRLLLVTAAEQVDLLVQCIKSELMEGKV